MMSCLIGYGISFVCNILFNLIQRKDSREMISFGSVMGWGTFITLLAFIILGLQSCGA